MVAISISRASKLLGFAFAGFASLAASPAFANTSAASAADVTAPVQDVGTTGIADGDEDFTELFAQWESLDGTPQRRTVTAPAAVSIPSRMPLDRATLTSDYGMRTHPVLGGRRSHKGIDLAAPTGTPVYATADGVVSRAERFSSYGLYISVEHGGNLQTRFAHLSRLNVSEGQQVKKGELIGFVGSTGRSTGPHLHYEVRVGGQAVNPVPYMKDNDPQIALQRGEGGQGGE